MGHMKDSYSSGTILRSGLAVGVLDGVGLQSQPHPTMTDSNPYVQHLQQKGYSAAECRTPAPRKTFPCTIGLRTFETEEEYKEALADFLNGY